MRILILVYFFLLLLTPPLFSAEKQIPKNSPYYTYYKKGTDYFERKQYDRAIKEFEKFIKVKPGFPQPYLNIAMIYEVNKKYGKAVEYYIRYLENNGGKINKAKESIKKIANLKYMTTDVEFKRLKQGDDLYIEGLKLAKKKNFSSAIDKFIKSLKIIPYYVKAHYGIALAYNNKKEYFKSYEHFMKVMKYDPDNNDYRKTFYYLGLFHDDVLHDYDAALKFYRAYMGRNGPRDVDKFIKPIEKANALSAKAIKLFRNNNKSSEPIKLLLEAIKIKPYNIIILNNLAVIYISQNKFDDADKNLQKALKIKKNSADTYYNLTCLYSKKGDTDESLKYFKKGIKYFSKDMIKNCLKDPDLRNVRNKDEFVKAIMNRMK